MSSKVFEELLEGMREKKRLDEAQHERVVNKFNEAINRRLSDSSKCTTIYSDTEDFSFLFISSYMASLLANAGAVRIECYTNGCWNVWIEYLRTIPSWHYKKNDYVARAYSIDESIVTDLCDLRKDSNNTKIRITFMER